MGETARTTVVRGALSAALAFVVAAGSAEALVRPRSGEGRLRRKQFSRPELTLPTANVPLAEVIDRLPNRAALAAFVGRTAADGSAFEVFVDPRSGAATNILGAFPLIPGDGVGNDLTLADLAVRLGHPVDSVDATVVAEATAAFVREHSEVLGVDPEQVGTGRAVPVTEELWQVSMPQFFLGTPVREGRIVASISHGNLVTIGAVIWEDVAMADVTPSVSAAAAEEAGFVVAEGRMAADSVLSGPRLEILPYVAKGGGYAHRLVWTFAFRRATEEGTWEATVDAHTGEVIAFGDIDHYVQRQIVGGVYPLANTESCPTPQTCGAMQYDTPMPFADTGRPAPNDFTNSAGVYDYTGGATSTTLTGRFARVVESCGPFAETSTTGFLDLGGLNGDHGCDYTNYRGNSPAARTSYYEVNKIAEMARGYLPFNEWIRGQVGPLPMRVNPGLSEGTCNAGYQRKNPGSPAGFVKFFSAGEEDGEVCRNTGEIAEVADHEWAHGLDDHDANDFVSNSGEGYADIAALYRNQSSCLGTGFFESFENPTCGLSPDGTGPNVDEAQTGPLYCTTECSGVRDADFARHVPATPATALGFVCGQCFEDPFRPGPCGRQVHCASAPVRQAAWDLVARDLAVAPFGYESQTAFIVANKLFYQGSGNVGSWYSCACGGATSDGCATENGYIQWLVADDDNGSLNDGTPHMTAIFNAFDRHGIACRTIPRANSGCPQGPGVAPIVAATEGGHRVTLSWNAIPAATRYWVFRTEGHAGCEYGKALIGETTGLTFTDTEVAAVRLYSYNVVAAGDASACFSRASNCVTVSPEQVDYRVSCSSTGMTNGDPVTCTVTSLFDFSSPVTVGCADLPGGASCSFSPATVTPPPNGSATTTLTVTGGVTPPGVYNLRVRGSLPARAGGDNSATVRWTLTDANGGTGNAAVYDAALRAPRCAAAGRSCDTGLSLVRGRGSLGPEPNAPNTTSGLLQPACPDGSGVPFPGGRNAGSIDRVMVYTLDGSNLRPGKVARLDAMMTPTGGVLADDSVDFFASVAPSGNWVHLGTRSPVARSRRCFR